MNLFLPGLDQSILTQASSTPHLGLHLLGEWYGCPRTHLLRRADKLRGVCLQLTREAGMQIVGDAFHQFSPEGVTGTVLLAESHLAVHTWPETGFVTIDVYVCNQRDDNRAKALRLFRSLEELLEPTWTHRNQITRGLPEEGDAASGKAGLNARV